MKVRRLVLCMMLSLAMVVTFIPMIAFAEDAETEDQSVEIDVQSEEPAPPAHFLSDEVKAKMADAEENLEEPTIEAKASTDEIASVSISLRQPACGIVVTGTDFGNYGGISVRQSPQPVVSIPAGVKYELDEYEDENYGIWLDSNEDSFEGVIKGGQTYYAVIWLRVVDDSVSFANQVDVKVNGKTPEFFEFPYDNDYSTLIITSSVTATHDYVKNYVYGTGYLKNGIQCDKCRGCGTEVNRKVVGGWSTRYVKSAKVKKGKKSLTVKWKKQSKKNQKKFDGYEIRYSTINNINTAKAITVGKSKKSKKIGKLAKKTKYYVWICSYKKVNGVKNYSNWKWGTVKTK